MPKSQAIKILTNLNPETIEKSYNDFYKYCIDNNLNEKDSQALTSHIIQIYKESKNHTIKSFCFLFLGAVFDQSEPPIPCCENTVDFIIHEIKNITNFDALDKANIFIHYISHMIYCADGLVKTQNTPKLLHKPLLNAMLETYLKSDQPYTFSEDILLAEFILARRLSTQSITDIIKKLAPTQPESGSNIQKFSIKSTNKRLLWTSLCSLNIKFKYYDQTIFLPVINDTVKQIFGE